MGTCSMTMTLRCSVLTQSIPNGDPRLSTPMCICHNRWYTRTCTDSMTYRSSMTSRNSRICFPSIILHPATSTVQTTTLYADFLVFSPPRELQHSFWTSGLGPGLFSGEHDMDGQRLVRGHRKAMNGWMNDLEQAEKREQWRLRVCSVYLFLLFLQRSDLTPGHRKEDSSVVRR